uniref:ATP synthase F0 subunit 8 n=1 Tax=Pollicipes polymerus TaxID=36137 RepID=Q6SL15_POLPY|nr:ATP synthase F0 subunit 8 [Pollicipes polymerus]AAS00858.1 ATP synthase F0 subunit 8 [Pollicipes polymerus]
MPHMSPMLWALILILTFTSIMVLMSMLYFSTQPLVPASEKLSKEFYSTNWMW